jgi:2-polyprenyl-3-methyl-5-hydroxy-6-metoxy-1,4-benzoquinol methylase
MSIRLDDRSAEVADANRRFYASFAEEYDRTEDCVVEERLARRLRNLLASALAALPDAPRVLDACGGSGNASLLLHELGATPTTVDISPEMLALYERKATARGLTADTHVGEIDEFLGSDAGGWHLIVFSSALHHLERYEETIDRALGRLAPGGILVTTFDPTRAGAVARRLRRFDYILHVLTRSPHRVPGLVAHRLTGRQPGQLSSAGALAERHALDGIDDVALARRLRSHRLEVLVHGRAYDGRFALTRVLYRILRQPSSFHLVVRRPQTTSAGLEC